MVLIKRSRTFQVRKSFIEDQEDIEIIRFLELNKSVI